MSATDFKVKRFRDTARLALWSLGQTAGDMLPERRAVLSTAVSAAVPWAAPLARTLPVASGNIEALSLSEAWAASST